MKFDLSESWSVDQLISWTVDQLESWSVGKSISWTADQLDSWSVGQSISWTVNQLDSRSVEQSISWTVDQLDSQSVGQLISWTVDQLDSWSVGQSISWTANQLDSQSVGKLISMEVRCVGNQHQLKSSPGSETSHFYRIRKNLRERFSRFSKRRDFYRGFFSWDAFSWIKIKMFFFKTKNNQISNTFFKQAMTRWQEGALM